MLSNTITSQTKAGKRSKSWINRSYYIQQVFPLLCPPPLQAQFASSLVSWNVDGPLNSCRASLVNKQLTHNLPGALHDKRSIKWGYCLFSIADKASHCQSFTVYMQSHLCQTPFSSASLMLMVQPVVCCDCEIISVAGMTETLGGISSLQVKHLWKHCKVFERDYIIIVLPCVFFLIFLIRGRNYCSQPWVVTPFSWPNLTEDE